jgi:hypothetical protein
VAQRVFLMSLSIFKVCYFVFFDSASCQFDRPAGL